MAASVSTPVSDPSRSSLAHFLHSLLQLTKPRIMVAVIFAGFTGMVMTLRGLPDLGRMSFVFLVLFITGAASAIQNSLIDIKIDMKMPRTSERDEAIRYLGVKNLWASTIVALIGCLVVSSFYLSIKVALLLFIAASSYVIWYTIFLKRRSPFGAILGGIPGALPILIGAYGVSDRFSIDSWLLFWFMMLWQPPHFWALTLKIEEDYRAASIPVLPVVYGQKYTEMFIYLYGFSLLPISLMLGVFAGYGYIYLISATVLGVYYLIVTLHSLRVSKDYDRAFKASLYYLTLLFLAIIIDILVQPL